MLSVSNFSNLKPAVLSNPFSNLKPAVLSNPCLLRPKKLDFDHSLANVSYKTKRRRLQRSSISFLVPPKASNSEAGEEAHQALETVLKLYSAINNRNATHISDVIGDECQCVCNCLFCFRCLQGKKRVLDFVTSLMKYLGNNIELEVKPTWTDGMNIGVSWRLEWKHSHIPLGKGFTFHICQIYQGKVVIRNIELCIQPLLHLEPFRLTNIILDKISSIAMAEYGRKRFVYKSILHLLFATAILFFTKPGFY